MLGPLTRITRSLLGDSNAIKSRYRPTRVMGVVASVCTHTRIAIRGRSSKKKKKKDEDEDEDEETRRMFIMVHTITAYQKIKSPPVGFEPTTFELEVQHASPLRHGGRS